MASAVKIATRIIGAALGASFWAAAAASSEEALITPSLEQLACPQTEPLHQSLPKFSDTARANILNIYRILDDIIFNGPKGQSSLLSADQVESAFLNNRFIPNEEEREGLRQNELPKYKDFLEQKTRIENDWNNLTDTQKRMAAANTLMGVNGLRSILGDLFEEIDADNVLNTEEQELTDLLGGTADFNYADLDITNSCAQSELPAPTKDNGTPHKSKPEPLIG